MIIPVGQRYQQTLFRMTKKNGKLQQQALRPTLFVPMTGEAEENRKKKPDPANPQAVNGDFELVPSGEQTDMVDFVPGWYYGRQVKQISSNAKDGHAPQGDRYARFENETPGLNSHLLQGIAVDGREVAMLRLSGRVRTE